MSALAVFNFEQQQIRTSILDETVWFVAKDLAEALEYAKTQNALDLCKNSNNAHSSQLNKINNLHPATKWIPESDMYRLVMKSTKKEAEKFQDWVVEEVLPSIRKTGGYSIASNQPAYSENLRAEESLRIADFIAQSLRVSESSKLGMFQKVLTVKAPELLMLLPSYAVDAPSTDLTGSSKPTKSLTALLDDNGYAISAVAFNKIALADEWLEKLTRKSSKGEKEFLSITDKGLQYGKNITSPSCPRETQPHWYVDSFKEFSDLVLKGDL